MTLHEAHEAEAARDAAMDQVLAAANLEWLIAAQRAVHQTARQLRFFTSDDVMERIDPSVQTHELRALGPVMTQAAKDGWIEKADRPGKLSRRRSLHASPRTVWKSLIYKLPTTSNNEEPLVMPVEITISASSLKELWEELSAFSLSTPTPHTTTFTTHEEAVAKKSQPKPQPQPTEGAVSGNGEAKRGPGRPKKNTQAAQEPEPDEELDADDDDSGNEEQTRDKLSAIITKHWREDIPAKKKAIRDFRASAGIGSMREMKADHFPAARKLIKQLDEISP